MQINFKKLFMLILFSITLTSYAHSIEKKSMAVNSVYQIRYPNQVKQLLRQINPQEMWNNLTMLTHFPDRSAKSQSGVEAAVWIKRELEELAQKSGRKDIRIFTIATKGLAWGESVYESNQPSIILQIGQAPSPGIVLSAHLDTVTKCGDNDDSCNDKGNIQGANDDGSGTVAVLEVARTLLFSGMHFKKPIYLIWYAGEEQELWGSQAVIADFQKHNVSISALMQLDQISYARNNDLTMYLASDKNLTPNKHIHTDPKLTLFTKTLIDQYVGRRVELSCQAGSDEEAWTDIAHVKAVRPLEADSCNTAHIYQDFHSTRDTMDKLSLIHMTDYLKLGISFVVELSEPSQS